MPTIKRLLGFTVIGLFLAQGVPAQQDSDRCHVYMVAAGAEDAAAIWKLIEEGLPLKEVEKRAAKLVGTLGEFDTATGEEQSTTKSFAIPGTSQFVTVTVFYTDESMAAAGVGPNSILLSLVIANKKLDTAMGAPDSIQAEVSVDQFAGKIRVKKVTVLNGKKYLMGMECERKAPRAAAR
jgi:hypothetical protein